MRLHPKEQNSVIIHFFPNCYHFCPVLSCNQKLWMMYPCKQQSSYEEKTERESK